jgi:hypothetical protein
MAHFVFKCNKEDYLSAAKFVSYLKDTPTTFIHCKDAMPTRVNTRKNLTYLVTVRGVPLFWSKHWSVSVQTWLAFLLQTVYVCMYVCKCVRVQRIGASLYKLG